MMKKIRKAVFPVAGLGTRFLPATKASPKEMLPVVDKPLIQYAVDEAAKAGIEQMIFITNHSKQPIENHFDRNIELESRLKSAGKEKLLSTLEEIEYPGVRCVYVRQSSPRGLGDAVLCAEDVVGDEPFVVLLADDLMLYEGKSVVQQMCEHFQNCNASIIGVEQIDPELSRRYGVVDFDGPLNELTLLKNIVEKPSPEQAPSHYGVAGRYLFTPAIFEKLKKIKPGVGGEIQLTDAIKQLMCDESVYASKIQAKRFDCGDKLDYLKASVVTALSRDDLSAPFREWLKAYL